MSVRLKTSKVLLRLPLNKLVLESYFDMMLAVFLQFYVYAYRGTITKFTTQVYNLANLVLSAVFVPLLLIFPLYMRHVNKKGFKTS